jgi:PKD repeat protein
MKHLKLVTPVVLAALFGSSCTMKDQEAPPFAGPSEFGKSVTVSISPDIITQDGASQSVVTITARGPNGEPLPNVSLRAEIQVGGVAADFGRLSSTSLVTDGGGRATTVYTAPASPAGQMVFEEASRTVAIAVTPVGTDSLNSQTHIATLRLLPPPGGVVVPTPQGLSASFTVSPAAPADNQVVTFDASASTPPANGAIAWYFWSFGDGSTAEGASVSHAFAAPGQYTVTLVVEDTLGRSRSTSRTVTVVAGANPSATFTFSPTTPRVSETVNFNAATTQPRPGRTIRTYQWVFGDGSTETTSSPQIAHAFQKAGTFNVTLTVTDDLGLTATSSATSVTVLTDAPIADFDFVVTNRTVGFNPNKSSAIPGRTIVSYSWSFGDNTTSTAATPTKTYADPGAYNVSLTIADSAGRASQTTTKTVTVQ